MIEYSLSLFLIIPIYALIHFYGKRIHRNEYWVYLGALILTIINSLLIAFNVLLPIGLNWIQNGNITFAIFTIVMFGGAVKKKTVPYKKILQVRRELAITGFIFLIPHAVLRLELALGGYNFTGIIAGIIMIPLVITSFTFIRKKMKPLTWKRVHYSAYIVFLMIYIHLGYVLFVFNGNWSIRYRQDSLLYHIVFAIYLVLKFKNRWFIKLKKA